MNKKLLAENEILKDNLARIHNELIDILNVRKEIYQKRKFFNDGDMELESEEIGLNQFK